MSKIIATALLLFLTLSYVLARPEPAFRDVKPMETHRRENETVRKVDVDEDVCKGLGEDECMMRRTLEAHLDYIYTQNHNKP